MSDRSYVGMETKKCVVCLEEYETENVLLDRRLRNSLTLHTCTGPGLCPKCNERFRGMVILIEIDLSKSKIENGKTKLGDAYRTGRVMGIATKAAKEIFNQEMPHIAFMGSETFELIEKLIETTERGTEEGG